MTRRRHTVLLLAALSLFAACSSGSDGADQAADPPAADGSAEGADDGDVVTRNPSQSGEADDGATTGGDIGGDTGGDDTSTDGGDTGGDDGGSSTAGEGAGDDTGSSVTTGGDATATTGDGDGGAATGDGTDGGAGDAVDDDPLAEIPLDEIDSVEDETGLVIVDIPNVWADVDGSADGDVRRLRASSDLAAFDAGFGAEGIALSARDVESGTADWEPALDALSAAATDAGCSPLGEGEYDDAVYRGLERSYDCPGTDLTVSLFGGTNEDSSTEWTLRLITQPGDEASRQLVFQSFLLD